MNAENEIILVTAFFNCGRDKVNYQKRTDDQYFQYFRFWARIKNNLIVYASKEDLNAIMEIRKEFGLEKKTQIVEINDIWSKEIDLLEAMRRVEEKDEFKKMRLRGLDVSNQAKYNYLMLMKYWCLQDAAKIRNPDEQIAWIDFGYNHGGEVLVNEEDFDFEWKHEFPDKINLFTLKDPALEYGLAKLMMMTDSIMGMLLVLRAKYCKALYQFCIEAMWGLISLDCMDDDQMLLRMSYIRHPEYFELFYSNWFMPICTYGNTRMEIAHHQVKEKWMRKIIRSLSNIKRKIIRSESGKEINSLINNIKEQFIMENKTV